MLEESRVSALPRTARKPTFDSARLLDANQAAESRLGLKFGALKTLLHKTNLDKPAHHPGRPRPHPRAESPSMSGPLARQVPGGVGRSLLDEASPNYVGVGKMLKGTTLTWTEGPSRYWEAEGETLHYRVIAGWHVSTLTVRDKDDIVYMRCGDGGDGGADLRAAARAFEIVAALAGPVRAIRDSEDSSDVDWHGRRDPIRLALSRSR